MKKMSLNNNNKTNFRLQSDQRQAGGLLMILGFCSLVFPSAGIVSGFGQDGAYGTDPGEIPFWSLLGGLCLFINGIVAVITGYMAVVHDFTHEVFTRVLMITLQTSWIPYITDMTAIGKGGQDPPSSNHFIPTAYDPSETDVKFVAAMGILAVMAYGFAFIGSIAFMVWSLHGYTSNGKPLERGGSYYKGRLGFYSGILALAGMAQLLLGAYSSKFGTGALDQGPVAVAMLKVSYPAISIFVGLMQTLSGIWGIARMAGFHAGPNDNGYQIVAAFQWIMVVSLQVIAQIAYLPEGAMAAAAPSVIAMSLGINLMPPFLDHKMRTLPDQLPHNYYTLANTSEHSLVKGGGSIETHQVVEAEVVDFDHVSEKFAV